MLCELCVQRFSEGPHMSEMSRRQLLLSLPALAIARRSLALQPAAPAPIRVRTLEPFRARRVGSEALDRVLPGAVRHADPGAPGRDDAAAHRRRAAVPRARAGRDCRAEHQPLCLGVDDFNVDRIDRRRSRRTASRRPTPAAPMKARVRMRGPDAGGAKEGTPELYFGDPDGIVVPAAGRELLRRRRRARQRVRARRSRRRRRGCSRVSDISHFTNFASDAQPLEPVLSGSLRPLDPLVTGAAAPTLGGRTDGAVPDVHRRRRRPRAAAPPAPPRPASINHVCMNMDDFKPTRS